MTDKKFSIADSETLTGTDDTILMNDSLTGNTGKDTNQLLAHQIESGAINIFHRFGVGSPDATANYASRRAIDGLSPDGLQNGGNAVLEGVGTALATDKLNVAYFLNVGNSEKYYMGINVDTNGSSGGTAPRRSETAAKWIGDTSNQADAISVNNGGAGDMAATSNASWHTTIIQAIARFASMREAFEQLSSPFNQHFVEWFSGNQIPSYWNVNNLSGSGITVSMANVINGGLQLDSVTTGFGEIDFNTIRPFDNQGCIAIWVGNRVSANHQDWWGVAGNSNGNAQEKAVWRNSTGQTFINLLSGDNVTSESTDSSIPVSTARYTYKVELTPSSVIGTINGNNEVTNTIRLPTVNVQPILLADNLAGAGTTSTRVQRCEVFNT